VAALLLSPAAAAARGQDLHVPENYFTIQEALDAAKPGDRVVVANGTYRQAIALRSGVTLESAGGPDSCLLIPVPGVLAMITADSLAAPATIRGFRLDGQQYQARQGIHVTASRVDILDNHLEGLNVGVYLEGCPEGLIARNAILRCRSAGLLIMESSPRVVSNEMRYSGEYSIAVNGRTSRPVIGGSRGRSNIIVSNKGSVDLGNGTPLNLDARYNNWGQGTAVEMNRKGYPANISTIEDNFDDPQNGRVDYRHWAGQPFLSSLLCEPARLILPALLAVAVVVGVILRISAGRRRAA